MSDVVRADDPILDQVPFGRSRALQFMGATLFGLALQLAAPQLARATNTNFPYPCDGFRQCHCCSGTQSCELGWSWPGPPHSDCPSGAQCWYTCVPGGAVYQCCDWHSEEPAGSHCICSELTQITC